VQSETAQQKPDRRSVLGIAVATVGITAIVLYGYDGRPHEGQGIALGLASGVTYAGVTVGLRGLRGLDPVWLSGINNLLGAGALGLYIVLCRGPIPWPSAPTQTLMLIAFGVLQMAIPYVFFARGLREIGAPEAGLITLLEPVLNPIWVLLLTGEKPATATLVGGGSSCWQGWRFATGRSHRPSANWPVRHAQIAFSTFACSAGIASRKRSR
jgi:drug/metabolite transporter (DMT)-like permease